MENLEIKSTEDKLLEKDKEFLQEQAAFHRKEVEKCCRHLGVLVKMDENNPDLFTDDFTPVIKETYEWVLGRLSDGEEDNAIEQILEGGKEQGEQKAGDEDTLSERARKNINELVSHCWDILSGWKTPIPRLVIERLTEQLPEKEAESDDEDVRQDAYDGLMDVLSNMETEQLVASAKEAKESGTLKLSV